VENALIIQEESNTNAIEHHRDSDIVETHTFS